MCFPGIFYNFLKFLYISYYFDLHDLIIISILANISLLKSVFLYKVAPSERIDYKKVLSLSTLQRWNLG